MTKINLDDYLETTNLITKGRICNSPEDIAECERINRHMRKVQQEVRSKFALSAMKAGHFVFTR